ncbi:hypothetical protein GGS20DRAFT_486410 [Poronia punctata]|nr:hypothetical protein GGS20DRAFT_486410 [Poronia punctata]
MGYWVHIFRLWSSADSPSPQDHSWGVHSEARKEFSSERPPTMSSKCKRWARDNIVSVETYRRGPKLLLKTAYLTITFMGLTYVWYILRLSSRSLFHLDYFGHNTLQMPNGQDSPAGLRMVVFGGGDVATPSHLRAKQHRQKPAWTEVMCRKLGCDTYLSFVPEAEAMGGAVMSNALLDAAHKIITSVQGETKRNNQNNGGPNLDYSWVPSQYPVPTQPDLAAQIDAFLSSPKPALSPAETLWVFNVGYTDIYNLAALPRNLALQVLDANVVDLFFHIKRLYRAAEDKNSPAFSDYYLSSHGPLEASVREDKKVARAPFRLYLKPTFDITLTPGFNSTRPSPVRPPHSSADHLRNAVFLTTYWNTLLETAVDDWLKSPDPEHWSVVDTVDIGIVKALAANGPLRPQKPKRRNQLRDIDIPFLRREVDSYDLAHYIHELMVDRQLRNADMSDGNGLGARPSEDGFLYISTPCLSRYEVGNGGRDVCGEPDNYLFYTDFVVGQRAIYEIGVRAARRFLDQVEIGSSWRGGGRNNGQKEG